jgi:hypothetical protein
MPSIVKLIRYRPIISSYLTENKSFLFTKAYQLLFCTRMRDVYRRLV